MIIFTLNKFRAKTLDIRAFEAVYNLILKNRKKLFDDNFFDGEIPSRMSVLNFITGQTPFFWLFLDKKTLEPLGFCYFYDIIKAKNHIQTVSSTICFDKKAFGPKAKEAAKTLLNYTFSRLNVYKIKAECYEDTPFIPNFLITLGFQHEATLKNETIVDFTPKNIEIWSIFNPNPLF